MQLSTLLGVAAIMGLVNATPIDAPETLAVEVTKVPLSEAQTAVLEKAAAASNSTVVGRDNGCTWTAYAGDFCNGGVGDAIPIGQYATSCIRTQDRHSFFISGACPTLYTILYEKLGCSGGAKVYKNGPGCYNVNTGSNWFSSQIARA